MISIELFEKLRGIVGAKHVRSEDVDREVYSYDGSLKTSMPDVVVFPEDTAQTVAVMAAASEAGVPCTARGFGTNLSGGTVPQQGGIVLCFTRMNRILSIEPQRRVAVVQPGVTNFELQTALAPLGFYYAPDPASQKVATFGGNVAENAGGPHCVKYGVTTNHILGLEAVLVDGQTVRLGGRALDPPGYDVRGLLIGAEGTMAVVTEVTVRILPKPESVITMLAIYDSVHDAASSVSAIIAQGIVPATLEMMDQPIICAVEDSFPSGYPRDAAAVLIIEVEGPTAGLRREADSIQEICRAQGCRSISEAKDDNERNMLWAGRRGAFGALARISPNFYVCDCTVPRNKLPEALEQANRIAKDHGFGSGNVLHAGDGNMHPVIFFDGRVPEHTDRVHHAGHEVMQACVELGGTLSGEHGIGLEKIGGMQMLFSEDSLEFQRSIRQALDPGDLLNPDKIFPEPRPNELSTAPTAVELSDESTPANTAEACEIVRRAAGAGSALLPIGGGRRADFGNLSSKELGLLRSERLTDVVDYDHDNQVLVCGAGMKLIDVQELLSQRRQWLPLRPPLLDGCTVGGMAALGISGPERLAYGATRDRVLGLRFVSGEGREIVAGGRVVKNVAGYDVPRLLVGSAGTLGFITELTLYIAAAPELCRALVATGTLAQCAAAAAELLQSSLQMAFVTAQPAEGGAWQLSIGVEGFEVTVRSQLDGCLRVMQNHALQLGGEHKYSVAQGWHQNAFAALHAKDFLFRADLPMDVAAELVTNGGAVFDDTELLIDFGTGRVHAALAELSDEEWPQLCALAQQHGGHALLERAPADFKTRHDPFGPARPEWRLTHQLKTRLDPHGVFAPGRLPGRK